MTRAGTQRKYRGKIHCRVPPAVESSVSSVSLPLGLHPSPHVLAKVRGHVEKMGEVEPVDGVINGVNGVLVIHCLLRHRVHLLDKGRYLQEMMNRHLARHP